MKAFLSHSSRDKEFVRAIARELGRQFCVFDEQAFETGEDFKTSIECGFDESCVFVLFASRNALASIWVEFEFEEAWFRNLRKTLKKSLVYLIDSSLEIDKLPDWLQRALIRRENSPKLLARDIRHHLDGLLRERQHPHFVGRSREVEELEQVLTPLDGSYPPHAVFVGGLPGIGRRSLVRRTSAIILNLRKYIEIRIGEGDSINDVCISVADHAEPYSTREGFERVVRQIKTLSDRDALQRTLANLRALVEAGELPIFLDEGGLLDADGYIRDPIKSILQEFAPNDEAYTFFISTRRPQKVLDISTPVVLVRPLKQNETKRLISLLANQATLTISPSNVSELTEYVAGYPPAAHFAIQLAKDYGLESVIADKTRLVQFRTSVFLKHFSRLNLDASEQGLLRLLATYSPLPFPAIVKVLSLNFKRLTDMAVRLVDLALIITTEEGYYRIADPVADAAVAAYGFPTNDQHKALSRAISEYLERSEIESPLLELSRVLFRAARWSKDDEAAEKAVHLSNDLIKLTETHYHARKYEEAIKFGRAALEERPDSVSARSYLIRAFIQGENWRGANEQIRELKGYGPPREVWFLTGFLERKRGNIPSAIHAYEEAVKLGRKGAATSRELAFCHFVLGNLPQAMNYIQEALERQSDNPYIVDLLAQIATRQGDEAAAREALNRLEVIREPLFYYHRLSRVEMAFGRLREAQIAARQAVESEPSPPFEVLAQLAYCEIELRNLREAEELLGRLDREFRKIRSDIRLGLRCRFEMAQDHYGEALEMCERINDKTTFFYKKIRRDGLHGELSTSALEDKIRDAYEKELLRLQEELEDITLEQFAPLESGARSSS